MSVQLEHIRNNINSEFQGFWLNLFLPYASSADDSKFVLRCKFNLCTPLRTTLFHCITAELIQENEEDYLRSFYIVTLCYNLADRIFTGVENSVS